ncbi:hypothetical protein RJ640_029558 [Escallonia rubra]|uniref:BED-type domain-containing protein n=1 Tax=Escallonia rubra TaxID=112253 RepID=A0AA88SGB3_9ASTE|nr:hypothetical protein RJ640_029558 [Escallonia rubra]
MEFKITASIPKLNISASPILILALDASSHSVVNHHYAAAATAAIATDSAIAADSNNRSPRVPYNGAEISGGDNSIMAMESGQHVSPVKQSMETSSVSALADGLDYPTRRPKKSSWVWNFFEEDELSGFFKCKLCSMVSTSKTSSGTSHLGRHLRLTCPRRGNIEFSECTLTSKTTSKEISSPDQHYDPFVTLVEIDSMPVIEEKPFKDSLSKNISSVNSPADGLDYPNKRPKKSSWVWNFFEEDELSGFFKCKLCSMVSASKTSSGTSHLGRHLRLACPRRGSIDFSECTLTSKTTSKEISSSDHHCDPFVTLAEIDSMPEIDEKPIIDSLVLPAITPPTQESSVTAPCGKGQLQDSGRKQQLAPILDTANVEPRTQEEVMPQPPPPSQLPHGVGEKAAASCFEDTKPRIDPLSSLQPPPKPYRRNHLPPQLLKKSLASAAHLKDFLVTYITATKNLDLNTMVQLANETFNGLNLLRDDYHLFHADVRDFIQFHSAKLAAESERNGPTKEILSPYNALVVESKAKKAVLSSVESNLMKARQRQVPIRSRIVEVTALLSNLKEELANGEKEIEALMAERDQCAKASLDAEAEVQKFGAEVELAEEMLKNIDQRLDSARAGIDEATKRWLPFPVMEPGIQGEESQIKEKVEREK